MRATVGNGKPRESWVVRFRLHVCRRSAQVGLWDVASPLRRRDHRTDRGHPLAARPCSGGPRFATLIGLPALAGIRVGKRSRSTTAHVLQAVNRPPTLRRGEVVSPQRQRRVRLRPRGSTAAGTSTAAATTTPGFHTYQGYVTPASCEAPRSSRTGDPQGSLSEKVRARGSKSKEVLPRVQV